MGRSEADAARGRIEPLADLGQLAPAELVIEAAPERLELKLELLGSVAAAVDPACVLATNTSSLSVTEIAAGVPGPERVVGMHFFNPAPVMRLVEVVAGAASGERALRTARALGEAMGKHVVAAADVPGFLVNRCNRPYSLESLKLAEERIAEPATIDRVMRLVGGFRMGPFELMDLIGIDTNHAVAVAFSRRSYGEPRYRPSPLTARMVVAGRLGRKSGRGWYSYDGAEGSHRPDDPDPPPAGGGEGGAARARRPGARRSPSGRARACRVVGGRRAGRRAAVAGGRLRGAPRGSGRAAAAPPARRLAASARSGGRRLSPARAARDGPRGRDHRDDADRAPGPRARRAARRLDRAHPRAGRRRAGVGGRARGRAADQRGGVPRRRGPRDRRRRRQGARARRQPPRGPFEWSERMGVRTSSRSSTLCTTSSARSATGSRRS